jgi:HlyD family secretion protein
MTGSVLDIDKNGGVYHGALHEYPRGARYARGALLLLSCVVTGCYPDSHVVIEENRTRPVETLPIQPQPNHDSIELIGRIEPWRAAVLSFEVPGTIEEVFVEQGRRVNKGDPIAKLVLKDFELAVQEKIALKSAAQEQLEQLREGTRKEDLAVAESAHREARVRTEYWESELKRRERLFDQGPVSASEVEQTRRERDAAREREQMAKAEWERAVAGPRKQTVAAAMAAVRAAEAAEAIARRQLEKATLLAPFAGRVERRMVDPGAYVSVFPAGGVPVVQLVDLSQADVVASVPETMRSQFQSIDSVTVSSATDSSVRGEGQLVSLSDMADDESGIYELRARLDNSRSCFTGGMVVIVTSTTGDGQPAIRIPLGSVLSAYGQPPYVMLLDDDTQTAKRQSVQLGKVTGNWVEVPDGLVTGDHLIVRGQHRILDGDRVEDNKIQLSRL